MSLKSSQILLKYCIRKEWGEMEREKDEESTKKIFDFISYIFCTNSETASDFEAPRDDGEFAPIMR